MVCRQPETTRRARQASRPGSSVSTACLLSGGLEVTSGQSTSLLVVHDDDFLIGFPEVVLRGFVLRTVERFREVTTERAEVHPVVSVWYRHRPTGRTERTHLVLRCVNECRRPFSSSDFNIERQRRVQTLFGGVQTHQYNADRGPPTTWTQFPEHARPLATPPTDTRRYP